MRGDSEIVFEPALVAVVNDIDAWIEVVHFDPFESWEAGTPRGRFVADKIVDPCGDLVLGE